MRPVILALFLLMAVAVRAQSPAAEWRTVETGHFRVHYPREYEEWSLRATSRLENIREVVAEEIGFVPSQRIDVIVTNPVAQPNGVAWPFLDTPRMIFYAEPPGPDEQLGAYGHWIDLLAVHETAHLVHMLRPSRNRLAGLVERSVLPLNPITLRAPRWVLEGYATVIEGRLTGAGRPTSAIRALILRRWAEHGRLPSYSQLNSDRRFLGMSMAYLMGSAYLEWLEERSGPGSLRNLWSRLTARHRRSFDEAFTGVFGESPDRLYGQFTAELTASAMTVRRAAPLVEGELFQETPRASGDPAVSPDGTRLAVVIRQRERPEKLVVWSTAPAAEEEKKYEERLEKILARDPEDVRPLRTKPLPRKELHSLTMPDGGDIVAPRWTRDGRGILFTHRTPDAGGFLHFDLYLWDFERLRRVTRLADVTTADPLPDGRTAVAVRSRQGATQLVTVDLESGAVTPRSAASIDVVETAPRVSPDGTKIARVTHRGGAWTLLVDDRAIELPGDAASPAWIDDDELVVTLFTRGFAELHRVRLDGTHEQLTLSGGGAFDPAPAPDGRIFFMSLTPDGYVVRVLPPDAPAPSPSPAPMPELVPALPPTAGAARISAAAASEALVPRPYGLGRQEHAWFTSTNATPDEQALELGLRLGDVIGRLDTLLIVSGGSDDAPRGVALASAWRGWPVEVHAHAFRAEDESGIELRGRWSRRGPVSRLTLEGGALSDELLFGSAAFGVRQVFGQARLDESIRVEADGSHYRAVAALSFRSGSWRAGLRYQHDGGDRVALGGLASSIIPRSHDARRVVDPALPMALLSGDGYDGWRIDSTMPLIPFNVFYQRHEIGGHPLSLAGGEWTWSGGPDPILKVPGLDLTLGVARILDAPLEGDTRWWLGMRWRP